MVEVASASPPRRTSKPAPARWPTAAAVTRGRHRNGSPSASVNRSAATPAPIGPHSAAHTCSESTASTTKWLRIGLQP